MEDRIFEMKLSIDKNSREFDLRLLEEIKKLSKCYIIRKNFFNDHYEENYETEK